MVVKVKTYMCLLAFREWPFNDLSSTGTIADGGRLGAVRAEIHYDDQYCRI